MATYKLKQKAYVDDQVIEEGGTVTVADDVIPAVFWQPMDAAARTAYLKQCTTGKFVGPAPRDVNEMPFVEFAEVNIEQLLADAANDQAAGGKTAHRAAA